MTPTPLRQSAISGVHLWLVGLALAALIGCTDWSRTTTTAPTADTTDDAAAPLHLVVIDDVPLADVIKHEWRARSDGNFRATKITTEDFLASSDSVAGADVIVFPNCLVGELAQRKIVRAIPKTVLASDQFDFLDIFSHIRRHEIRWGKNVVAVPFGSPQFVLMLQADSLRQVDRSAPTTWDEYASLVERLTTRFADNSGADESLDAVYPTVEPLAPGWAGRVLLARAAAYIYDRSRYSTVFDFGTLEPLIDQPPFVRALEQLTVAYQAGPAEAIDFGPEDTIDFLLERKCAMAISWPAGGRTAPAEPPTAASVHISALPGSAQRYDFSQRQWTTRDGGRPMHVPLLGVAGRMGAIARGARNIRGAANLLSWLAGPRQSSTIASRSEATTLFRQSHMQRPEVWIDRSLPPTLARPYAELVAHTQSQPAWVLAPRIPGQHRYMQALDQAVRDAVTGKSSPQESLSAAAAQWREITKDLGRERQREAYMRSLGLD